MSQKNECVDVQILDAFQRHLERGHGPDWNVVVVFVHLSDLEDRCPIVLHIELGRLRRRGGMSNRNHRQAPLHGLVVDRVRNSELREQDEPGLIRLRQVQAGLCERFVGKPGSPGVGCVTRQVPE